MSDAFDLSSRTALVTGGAKGLGYAMARAFASHGADLFICGRDGTELERVAGELRSEHGRGVEFAVSDLATRQGIDQLVSEVERQIGAIDILVNNAGGGRPQPIDEVDDEVWDEFIQLNLTSCMALTRAFVPGMKARGWGRVIYISSIIAFAASPGRSGYAASKAGVVGMARAQALDLGESGITVNSIAPGPFLTDLPKRGYTDEQLESTGDRTALKRWGEPHEIAGPALLLASDAGSYITGSTLTVDGGLLANAM